MKSKRKIILLFFAYLFLIVYEKVARSWELGEVGEVGEQRSRGTMRKLLILDS